MEGMVRANDGRVSEGNVFGKTKKPHGVRGRGRRGQEPCAGRRMTEGPAA